MAEKPLCILYKIALAVTGVSSITAWLMEMREREVSFNYAINS
jgi:hypothetical protein